MPSKQVTDFRAFITENQRPQRETVKIYLRGDIRDQIYDLDAQLAEIGDKAKDTRLNGDQQARALATKIKKLEAEAEKAVVKVVLEALPKKEWRELVAKHPATDKVSPFNMATIWDDAIPACWVEPEIDAETRDMFLEKLSEGQFDKLAETAYALNKGDGAVPFSQLASMALRNSDETSKQREPGT
jgi:hypothetical protein